jgi:hypothetical protein
MLKTFYVTAAFLFILWVLGLGFHFIAGPLFYVLFSITAVFLIAWLVRLVRIEQ